MRPEWGWDTNENGIAIAQPIEAGRRRVSTACHRGRDALRPDVLDVRLTLGNGGHLDRIDVETEDGESGLAEDERQRQPDISLADNPDSGLSCADAIEPSLHSDLEG
jgi:hypothetical protein